MLQSMTVEEKGLLTEEAISEIYISLCMAHFIQEFLSRAKRNMVFMVIDKMMWIGPV